MSVAKVTEISASSKESFNDAIKKGIKRAVSKSNPQRQPPIRATHVREFT